MKICLFDPAKKEFKMRWNPNSAYNELPLVPPKNFSPSRKILLKTTQARVALATLNQTLNLTSNNQILLETIPVLEAQSSSEIEAVYTTTDNMFKHVDVNEYADPATKEALRYKTAIWEGIASLKKCPISSRTMSHVCSVLRNAEVQVRNLPGTYIGNSVSQTVIYTPPVGASVILKKLDNLAQFMNDNTPDEHGETLDPLVRMAIAHYQFEAIHPFSDGNGRTGRVLNILFLIDKQVMQQPILYLSKYMIENKNQYYQKLLAVTKEQDWEAWILFMLDAIETTAKWTLDKVNAVVQLRNALIDYMKSIPELNKIYSRELVDCLFMRPYCRVSTLINHDIAKRQTAMKYLNLLVDFDVLEKTTYKGEKLFCNKRLLKLLSNDSNHYQDYLRVDTLISRQSI